MRTSTKAVLLSALVLPGAGQLYLKRYAVGAALLLATVGALALLLAPVVATGNALAERIVSGELQLDANLVGEVESASAAATAEATPATVTLLAAWVFGIVHAWLIGRKRDAR